MQQHITIPGGTLACTDVGSGNVVVLVHGFGEDSRIWQEQVAALSPQYRCIVPDLPGSGQSTVTQAPFHTSIEAMAAAIHTLLAAKQIDTCTMVGHSMGGYVTLAFAERYPHLLNGLSLIHSTAFADSEEKKEARRKSIAFLLENGTSAFLKATLPNLFGAAFKENYPQRIAELERRGSDFSPAVLTGYYEAMMKRPDRSHILKEIQVPVGFFIGAGDKAVDPADATTQAAWPTISLVQIVPGIAHMGMWEAPQQLHQFLVEFLQLVNHKTFADSIHHQ